MLVCGGRDYWDKAAIRKELAEVKPTAVIHGAASGADKLAGEVAGEMGIPVEEFPARWNDYGRAAGVIRNQMMLTHGKPDLVVAFPGGKGTADMVQRALKAHVPVRVIPKGE